MIRWRDMLYLLSTTPALGVKNIPWPKNQKFTKKKWTQGLVLPQGNFYFGDTSNCSAVAPDHSGAKNRRAKHENWVSNPIQQQQLMRHHYPWVVHCKTTSMTPLSASSHRSIGQNILGATKEAQHWSINPSSRRLQHQKTAFLFYCLQLKNIMCRTEEIFFFFCPFTTRYPMEPHTCMKTSLGEPTRINVLSQLQQWFPHSPICKTLVPCNTWMLSLCSIS